MNEFMKTGPTTRGSTGISKPTPKMAEYQVYLAKRKAAAAAKREAAGTVVNNALTGKELTEDDKTKLTTQYDKGECNLRDVEEFLSIAMKGLVIDKSRGGGRRSKKLQYGGATWREELEALCRSIREFISDLPIPVAVVDGDGPEELGIVTIREHRIGVLGHIINAILTLHNRLSECLQNLLMSVVGTQLGNHPFIRTLNATATTGTMATITDIVIRPFLRRFGSSFATVSADAFVVYGQQLFVGGGIMALLAFLKGLNPKAIAGRSMVAIDGATGEGSKIMEEMGVAVNQLTNFAGNDQRLIDAIRAARVGGGADAAVQLQVGAAAVDALEQAGENEHVLRNTIGLLNRMFIPNYSDSEGGSESDGGSESEGESGGESDSGGKPYVKPGGNSREAGPEPPMDTEETPVGVFDSLNRMFIQSQGHPEAAGAGNTSTSPAAGAGKTSTSSAAGAGNTSTSAAAGSGNTSTAGPETPMETEDEGSVAGDEEAEGLAGDEEAEGLTGLKRKRDDGTTGGKKNRKSQKKPRKKVTRSKRGKKAARKTKKQSRRKSRGKKHGKKH